MRTLQGISRIVIRGMMLCAFAFCTAALCAQQATPSAVWNFNRINSLGGHLTTVLGHPRIIHSPYGKAVEFNGVDDALFVNVHPLAHDATWTWEVIFRPDADGAEAQRFFHLQETDASGADVKNHMTLEIRIVNGEWCLDSFAVSNGVRIPLLNCKLTHPLGKWYRVTFVYDGKEARNYVDSELEGSGEAELAPQGDGRTSIGTRITKTFYFKGAMLMARFTPRALQPGEFLKFPAAH